MAKNKFKELSKRIPKNYKLVDGKYKKFSNDGELASMWESKSIRYQVTCQLATSNDDVYSEHVTLKDAIASARKAQQSFMNVKIKDLEDGNSWYDIDNAEQDLNDGLYEGKHYGGAFDIIDSNGKKLRESNDEDYDDNAATFLDTLEKEVKEAAHKFMLSVGFPEDEADDYLSVSTDINDDYVMVAVGAELGYESISKLCDELNKVIVKHDKDAYFEPECPGRIVAYLFGIKNESLTESNHNVIEDRDYATGEKLFNALKDYLDSLDQIDMDGEDYNWQPSEFNAKNLNADGEIYLVSGAYILIYPYINEWAEDYFRVLVIDAETCELDIQIKNGIENIFNKFKNDNWKLVFEG